MNQIEEKTNTNKVEDAGIANLDRGMMHRINKRAWELARIAYEDYRDCMQRDVAIKAGQSQPEDWKPE